MTAGPATVSEATRASDQLRPAVDLSLIAPHDPTVQPRSTSASRTRILRTDMSERQTIAIPLGIAKDASWLSV